MKKEPRRTPKTSISQAEYLQLVGLKLLADGHNSALEDIRKAAVAITAETDQYGHTGDLIYGSNENVDDQLKKLALAVRKR